MVEIDRESFDEGYAIGYHEGFDDGYSRGFAVAREQVESWHGKALTSE